MIGPLAASLEGRKDAGPLQLGMPEEASLRHDGPRAAPQRGTYWRRGAPVSSPTKQRVPVFASESLTCES